jgi:DNA (cytosine-5)-methyltransferase 1
LQTSPDALDQEGKLNGQFVEYMMGLPIGWVTDLPLSRAQQLKMLGNGVVPQQAYHALELLCQ